MRVPERAGDLDTAGSVRVRCLELAWRSLGRGTLPIGAVLTGPDGRVVAEGRGRMLEPGVAEASGGSAADGCA